MIWEQIPEGYYAVPDPDATANRMTYWRRHNGRGNVPALSMWPANQPVGETARIRRIVAAILADTYAASVEFARFNTRCCKCGRVLAGPKSKTSAVGPECRKYVPSTLIDRYLIPGVAMAHAAAIETEQEELFQ